VDVLKSRLSSIVSVVQVPNLLRPPDGPSGAATAALVAAATAAAAAAAAEGPGSRAATKARLSLNSLISTTMAPPAPPANPLLALPWSEADGESRTRRDASAAGDGSGPVVELQRALTRARTEVQSLVRDGVFPSREGGPGTDQYAVKCEGSPT